MSAKNPQIRSVVVDATAKDQYPGIITLERVYSPFPFGEVF
jgi:hypothetical protein